MKTKLLILLPLLSLEINAQYNTFPDPGPGDVGIGNYGLPAAKLHVQDNTYIGSNAGQAKKILSVAGYDGNTFQNNLWLRRASAGNSWLTSALHDGISIDGSFQTPGSDTKTWWERNPYADVQAWGTGNQSYMTLNQGRLGINFTSPAARLDVQETDNTKMSFIARSAHSADNTTCIYACVSRDLTQAFLVGQNNYGGVANNWKGTFIVYGNGKTLIGAKRILSNHLHADAFMQVDGKVACKELVVIDPTKWADFVFDNGYKLRPLNQVEKFYLENKHLPDVPSESEVMKNGINTGEMDAILLQKIEELTLYLVELNKKVDHLEKENASLKNNK